MDIKFVSIIKSFFPKGKIWEFQTNFNYLIDGISVEFSRLYNESKDFYNNFNIINSDELAILHGRDYIIDTSLYSKKEIQRIIVEYINKDLGFNQIIEDFASFIGYPITYAVYGAPAQFGVFEFAETFGDDTDAEEFQVMNLIIILDETIECPNFRKIKFLVDYLKPPYLYVSYINKPVASLSYLEFGRSTFPSEFGNVSQC